jgi:GTP-binding protein era
MHFPSDDELMAGPNAFEGVDIDSLDFPEENGDEASEEAGHADFEGADFGDSDLDEADDEIAQDVADSVDSLRQLRAETNAAADIVIPDFPEDFRAGFISIVGRPNVGKSTLTNALVGHKVAITSGRPETTRHNIRGIVHGDNYQLVLVDTPGYHRPRTLLGKRLNDMVREALAEVDCVIFCLPANQRIGPGDQFIARELRSVRRPIIAVATKCDSVPRERVLEHLMAIEKLGEWSAIVPVSSFENKGIDRLREVLAQTVPLSPPLYPQDDISDESRETMIAEFIREAALEGVRDELPHSLAVQVEEIIERPKREGDDRPPLLDIHVNVYVERDSQKAIIIGKKGARLKEIGTRARANIEEYLGRRVYLDLHVRTAKDWQSDPKMLQRLGF